MERSLADRVDGHRVEVSAASSPATRARAPHAWERWGWAWHVLFYALLLLSLAASLGDVGLYGDRPVALVSLSVLLGGWYWLVVMRPGWIEGTRRALLYLAVTLVLWFPLLMLHPSYHLLLVALFSQIYCMLPIRMAIPGSVILTALLVARSSFEQPDAVLVWVAMGIFSVLFGTFFGLWIDSIIRQSAERQRLIDELEATREDLAAEERRNGILEERSRLAREIHDTLAQGFVSIVMHLEAAEAELAPDAGPAWHHLRQAKQTARENLIEARRLVAALRPEILDSSSLPEALQRLAARFSEETGIRADFTVTGEQRHLSQDVQVALLRVAQEALANARKHSRASTVTMTLSYLDDLALLDVHDDGRGFDPASISGGPDGGFGLRAMRERVERLDGQLHIESAPGDGTTLAVQLPADALAGANLALELR